MWRGRMTGFDLETTGPNPEAARIVSAAIVRITSQGADETEWLVRQEATIPDEATAVHGITTEHANEYGLPLEQVLGEIIGDIRYAWQCGDPVVGHNISYDLTVLDREVRRAKPDAPRQFTIEGPVVDTLVIDKHFDTCLCRKSTLEALATRYMVKLDDAHNAASDALTACRIAWVQASRYKLDSLHELHQQQATWSREQREAFIARKARRGEAIEDRSTSWPVH